MSLPSPGQELDFSRPSVARVYDYLLNGKDNFESDRDVAHRALALEPTLRDMAKSQRGFLCRAVRLLAERGIDQFLDLGSGLPTKQNVHQVALDARPTARVVYVDNDPIVVAHGRALLETEPDHVGYLDEDVTVVEAVLNAPVTRRFIDFDRPVALLILGILHLMPDSAAPQEMVKAYRSALAPGSCLAISHGTQTAQADVSNEVIGILRETGDVLLRTPDQVMGFFGDWPLLEPGLVKASDWRPAVNGRRRHEKDTWILAGVAEKP